MAFEIGKSVAVCIGGNYYEGKIIGIASNPKAEVIAKIDCAEFSKPSWIPSQSVFEIE